MLPKTDSSLAALEESLIHCRRCPRLVAWREEVARKKRRAFMDWTYWGKPVPGFGDSFARLLVVGLAPGAHGSNRTGRMFTGDASGEFLYAALHRAGFASQPASIFRTDDLTLKDVFITAVVRCCPPDNKPLPEELAACRPHLIAEMRLLPNIQGIVALGSIAFNQLKAIYREAGHPFEALSFGHHALLPAEKGRPWLLASYHPSRQNTQTGRLTAAMFDRIWETARNLLDAQETL